MPNGPVAQPSWANYLLGVLAEMRWPGGVDVAFGGDLPIGAGVSSSAALENATALAANELFSLGYTRLDLLRVAHRAENHFVGVSCGIMDMLAGMMGRKNTFIHLDCQTLTWEYLPFEAPDLAFVLCHSGVERRLVASEYGVRRRECEQGLAILRTLDPGLEALSKATPALLEVAKDRMPKVVFRRCRYVVEEVARVAAAVEALRHSNHSTLGTFLYQTHEGLRTDFEVSCRELDFLVEQATRHPGCLGARLMGAGFGGCTLNLVHQSEALGFIAQLSEAYARAFSRPLPTWVVRPSDGAEVVFSD